MNPELELAPETDNTFHLHQPVPSVVYLLARNYRFLRAQRKIVLVALAKRPAAKALF